MSDERELFEQQVKEIEQWFKVSIQSNLIHHDRTPFQSPRFARTKRPYTAADVASKRGTIEISYPSGVVAKKLFALLEKHAKNHSTSHTYGA